jgi:hypothetical protein
MYSESDFILRGVSLNQEEHFDANIKTFFFYNAF